MSSAEDYVPTLNLRFVERPITVDQEARLVRVLQQGWVPRYGGYIEWRDVPLEVEQATTGKEPGGRNG